MRKRSSNAACVVLPVLLWAAASSGCTVLVTFDPYDAGGDDGDAGDAGEGLDAPEADVEGGEAGRCGDGVVGPEEECEGAEVRECVTSCETIGTESCSGCRWSGACAAPAESCNGIDDDCNGSTDEGYPCSPGARVPCDTWCGSIGTGICTPACLVPTGSACATTDEACNGRDDDCDTVTDNDFACIAGERLACPTSCGTEGYRLCTEACEIPTGTCLPPDESCNGADDDCDTLADETFDCVLGRETLCATECGSEGLGTCAADCSLPAPGACAPPAEICNGVDDDCDGACDDGFPCCAGEVLSCTTACGTTGSAFCSGSCALPSAGDCLAPALDMCDGVDDDCDTLTDEDGYARVGGEVRVTNATGRSDRPSLAWTGEHFALAWRDEREAGNSEIRFARLDGDGARVGAEVRVTNAVGLSSNPSLVWTGERFGVAWRDDRFGNAEVLFVRLGSEGEVLSDPVRLSSTLGLSTHPSLVWTGAAFAVAWRDETDAASGQIRFTRIDSAGVEVPGAQLVVANAGGISDAGPSLAYTGDGYALAWDDTRYGNAEISFQRLDATGRPSGSTVRVTDDPAASLEPSLVALGTGFALVWRDFRDGNFEIYFQRLDLAGLPSGDPVRVTDDSGAVPAMSTAPRLIRTPTELGVAWQDYRTGDHEIWFVRLDRAGRPVAAEIRVSASAGESLVPSPVFTGSGFGLAWSDRRDLDYEIYFARIGCL
jgi:hypothetical protein